MLPRPALTFALSVVLCSTAVAAQTSPPAGVAPAEQVAQYDTPAYVASIEGGATLERDGRVEASPLNMPLLSGDRLRTSDGRVEVRFADGGRLFLDNRTTLDVMSDELVRLADGRVRVMEMRTQQVNYRIDSTAGSVRLLQAGDYRVALLRDPSTALGAGERETQLELAVIRGAGEIFTENGTTPVHAGERAYASAGLAPSYAYAYNSASMDEFDRWSEMQRGTVYAAPSSQSAQYLPPDMSTYASTFDQYGDWRYQQDNGYVWYPRVASDWRPYYNGRWSAYPTYGWTWIAGDPFGYPTHHYGRWGISAGLWFWIPSAYWGPAYVSWGYAPNYVSWCPLGWNNHAVFSIGYYNVGPAYYSSHYHGHYYSAWTTVHHDHFGHGYAYQHAVNFDHGYTGAARPHFTEGHTPAYDHAVARGTAAPVRYAGTRVAPASRGLPAEAGSYRRADGGIRAGSSPRGVETNSQGRSSAFDAAQARSSGRSSQPETPRYINRGNEIVRSQTGRSIPPRDTAVTRTPSDSAPSYPRPSYSAPSNARPTYSSPSDAAVPRRAEPPSSPGMSRTPRAWDNPSYPPPAPGVDRSYERAVPRVEPQSARGRTEGRPYDRQNVDMASPTYGPQPPARSYERAAPGPSRPSGGYDRPVERSAPPAPRASGGEQPAPRPSGGERAAPRSSGGGGGSQGSSGHSGGNSGGGSGGGSRRGGRGQ